MFSRLQQHRPASLVRNLSLSLMLGTLFSVGCLSGLDYADHHGLFHAKLDVRPAPPAPPGREFFLAHRVRLSNPLRGLASWYGDVWNGRPTASGEIFDDTAMTAAHKTLPLGTVVRVTDVHTRRSVIVRINDRGTLTPNRIIDLSSAAADELGILDRGIAPVKLEVLGRS